MLHPIQQPLSNIQRHTELIRRQRLGEIRQVAAMVYARVATDTHGEHRIRRKHGDDFEFVDGGSHRDCVVAWTEDEVIQESLADVRAVRGKVHRNIALRLLVWIYIIGKKLDIPR